jgi:hypothetical protein
MILRADQAAYTALTGILKRRPDDLAVAAAAAWLFGDPQSP